MKKDRQGRLIGIMGGICENVSVHEYQKEDPVFSTTLSSCWDFNRAIASLKEDAVVVVSYLVNLLFVLSIEVTALPFSTTFFPLKVNTLFIILNVHSASGLPRVQKLF